jgi:hypothetical protein
VRRILPALLLLALPDAAHACAVCGAAVDRNNAAFVGITILLSLLPVAMIGAGVWWAARRANLAAEFAEREVVAAPGRPATEGER